MSLWMSTTSPTSPAKSRMRSSAGSVRLATSPAIFEDDELLVDRELADAREDAGKRLQHAPDVVGRVHVGRVEARDHRIEAGLLLLRQRPIRHRDERVGERVVVEVGVAIEVVGRRAGRRRRDTTTDCWSGMPKQRRAPDPLPHDVEEGPDVGAFLDVVGEVEVAVVDVVGRDRPREHQQHGDEPPRRSCAHQNDISRLAVRTEPVPPTCCGTAV